MHAADAAALAGARGVLDDAPAALSPGFTHRRPRSRAARRRGLRADRPGRGLPAGPANNATLTSYCYNVYTDTVRVTVRMNVTNVGDGTATAAAEAATTFQPASCVLDSDFELPEDEPPDERAPGRRPTPRRRRPRRARRPRDHHRLRLRRSHGDLPVPRGALLLRRPGRRAGRPRPPPHPLTSCPHLTNRRSGPRLGRSPPPQQRQPERGQPRPQQPRGQHPGQPGQQGQQPRREPAGRRRPATRGDPDHRPAPCRPREAPQPGALRPLGHQQRDRRREDAQHRRRHAQPHQRRAGAARVRRRQSGAGRQQGHHREAPGPEGRPRS